jgi:hypothetical protein
MDGPGPPMATENGHWVDCLKSTEMTGGPTTATGNDRWALSESRLFSDAKMD